MEKSRKKKTKVVCPMCSKNISLNYSTLCTHCGGFLPTNYRNPNQSVEQRQRSLELWSTASHEDDVSFEVMQALTEEQIISLINTPVSTKSYEQSTMEFEEQQKYACPSCQNIKEFCNPCIKCSFPLNKSSKEWRRLLKKKNVSSYLIREWSAEENIPLPSIQTARGINEINKAVEEGLRPIVCLHQPHPNIKRYLRLYRHIRSGRMDVFTQRMGPKPGYVPLMDVSYYPYAFENPFAAYMIPITLKIGTVVWLEDLIEDLIGTQYIGCSRLDSAAAIWDGQRMVPLYSKENDIAYLVG